MIKNLTRHSKILLISKTKNKNSNKSMRMSRFMLRKFKNKLRKLSILNRFKSLKKFNHFLKKKQSAQFKSLLLNYL